MTREEAKRFGLQLLHGIMERNESYPVYANNVKQAIDALSETSGSSEIPNDLEEASSKFATHTAPNGVSVEFLQEKLSFQEGAKWQKEQDQETIELAEDHAYLAGAVNEREKMMKEAVEGVLVDNVDGTQEICLHGNRYGNKVRIIIVKEDSHE